MRSLQQHCSRSSRLSCQPCPSPRGRTRVVPNGPATAALMGTGEAGSPHPGKASPPTPLARKRRRGGSGRCPRGQDRGCVPVPGPRRGVTAWPSWGASNTSHRSPPTTTHRSALRTLRPAPAAPLPTQPQPISAVLAPAPALGPALLSQYGHQPWPLLLTRPGVAPPPLAPPLALAPPLTLAPCSGPARDPGGDGGGSGALALSCPGPRSPADLSRVPGRVLPPI